jgi:hypothetical protein
MFPPLTAHKLKRVYISCAIMLMNMVCLAVAIEVPFRIAHDIYDHYRDHTPWEYPDFLRFFRRQEPATRTSWEEVFKQEDHIYSAYQPFEETRMEPLAGKTITIGEDGFRTVPGQHEKASFNVYVLGASTITGVGSPDWLTIPALLQRLFNTRTSLRVNVYNRGIPAWVSSQEVIYLVNLLKSGVIPNVVIFYDGDSDIVRAVQNGTYGTTGLYWSLTDFFKGDSNLVNLVAGRRDWGRIRFISYIIKKLRKHGLFSGPFIPFVEQQDYNPYLTFTEQYPQLSEIERQRLAQDVFQTYLDNIRFVKALAKVYHFTPFFFWQPTLYSSVSHKPFTPEEVASLKREPLGVVDLNSRILPLVKKDNQDIIYLGDAFDDMNQRVFIDGAHVLTLGYERVAALIFNQVMRGWNMQPAVKAGRE